MTALEKAKHWLSFDIDKDFRSGIESLIEGPEAALEDAFYTDLAFGTGGMRGVMGVGSNRVNKYTLGFATQGLANYLMKSFAGENIKVAIAYDCRHHSREFARQTAEIFSANGVEVFLFEDLRPTPVLSFAVRHFRCHSGIVITASHNPPEYNGYKVYWNDGAQITAPHDKAIIDEVGRVNNPSLIRFNADGSNIHMIGAEVDEAFIRASLAQRRSVPTNKQLKIVLTSLHGTSITLLPKLLSEAGYENIQVVEEQAIPDGDFPTVKSPNPEEREALDMAIKLAEKSGADLVIGTDPDADRIGVAVRDTRGKLMLLNGNQTGVLLTDFLLKHTALKGDEFIAYTIVSSDLFGDVAHSHGVDTEVCLTGFKHIAALIRANEGLKTFVVGGEESYGYMVGDFVRDKDALTAALIFCDYLGEVLAQGSNTESELVKIYQKHGLYLESLVSITKKGKEGSEEIDKMMHKLRHHPPLALDGDPVIRIDDLQSGVSTDLETGHQFPIELPSSNVLQFITASGSKVSARPSGTEPKIKFYFSLRKDWEPGTALASQQESLQQSIERIKKELNL